MEKEIHKTITFLEVAITRNEQNRLSVNWYRKPTWSGRCLNFGSNHPLTYKRGVVYNLVDRAILLSDVQFQAANLELIEKVLRENFYPGKFVKDNIKHRLDILTQRGRNATNHRTQNVEVKQFVSIPYVEQLSKKIAGILKRHNISTAYRNTIEICQRFSNRLRINWKKMNNAMLFIASRVKAIIVKPCT